MASADLSRVIILITDGEDHESFALDAAKAAAERGIRIIAIGFGDEAGNELFVTDPRTGARTRVVDSDGHPVTTRLDGAMLEKIALETDGVYVPAGTGVLDLKSIYDANLAPLTRGQLADHERVVKQEGFQWMVLLAIVSLVGASVVASGRSVMSVTSPGINRVVASLILLMAFLPASSKAQATQEASEPPVIPSTSAEAVDDATFEPRQVFNDAVSLFEQDDLDAAEKQWTLVRRHTHSDGLARYRATYNLGWVEVRRADQLIQEQPKQALKHLQAAAAWFRDAVRLQPDEITARQNLELTTRRAVALADSLAGHDQRQLEERMDELVQEQRELAGQLQRSIERVASDDPMSRSADVQRTQLKQVEVEQRQILSSVDELAGMVSDETQQLEAVKEDERTAEQRLRLAQLGVIQHYLHAAVGRLGQVRRQLRQGQAERAYRRASAGLDQLKRARDQLRDLGELLAAVIGDATMLVRQTGGLAAATDTSVKIDRGVPSPPAWLTPEYLSNTLRTTKQRTDEVAARVKSGLPQADQPSEDDGEQARLVAVLREASPIVHQASGAFAEADRLLESRQHWSAYNSMVQATTHLIKVRELFLNIRGLVELIFSDQVRIQSAINSEQNKEVIHEYRSLLTRIQASNIERGGRLERLIQDQLEAVTAEASVDDQDKADGSEQENLELADKLLTQVMTTFDQIVQDVGSPDDAQDGSSDHLDISSLKAKVDLSVVQLDSLRRLFFSVIEHLRQTAQKQVQLADETRDVAVLAEEGSVQAQLGPLTDRQGQIADFSEQIAAALRQQSQQNPQAVADQGAVSKPGQDSTGASQEMASRFAQAADRVDAASQAMEQAVDGLGGEPPHLQVAQDHQASATEELELALRLLMPPEQEDSKSQQEQQEQQQQAGGQQAQDGDQQNQSRPQGGQSAEADKKSNEEASQQFDAERLLQAVRDRQAQRQRQRNQRGASGYVPVDKDW